LEEDALHGHLRIVPRQRPAAAPEREGLGAASEYTRSCQHEPITAGSEMPVREIVTKTIALVVVFGALLTGGLLMIYGPKPANDYLDTVFELGWVVFGIAIAVGAVGVFIILGIIRDARIRQREAMLQITQRMTPPAPPPPWGMGDIGRPGSGVVALSEHPRGGRAQGSPRVMSFTLPTWDAPLLIVGLLLWTGVFVYFFAQHCGGAACH
jgi:hypothetical protein